MQLTLCFSPPTPRRRSYMTSDHRYLATHYAESTAAACAAQLGRTVGSVYEYIARFPELRKRSRV